MWDIMATVTALLSLCCKLTGVFYYLSQLQTSSGIVTARKCLELLASSGKWRKEKEKWEQVSSTRSAAKVLMESAEHADDRQA